MQHCEVCGSNTGVAEDSSLLGCDAVGGWAVTDVSEAYNVVVLKDRRPETVLL
jgi:hypothetical protein